MKPSFSDAWKFKKDVVYILNRIKLIDFISITSRHDIHKIVHPILLSNCMYVQRRKCVLFM